MPIAELESDFPNLQFDEWEITSPVDENYNCIAFAVRDTKQFWDPSLVGIRGYYWPPGVARDDSLNSWIRVFEIHGYRLCADRSLEPGHEKVAIYVDTNNFPNHVARQLPDGQWTSKLGKGEDIRHRSVEALESDLYGKAAVFLKRQITGSMQQ